MPMAKAEYRLRARLRAYADPHSLRVDLVPERTYRAMLRHHEQVLVGWGKTRRRALTVLAAVCHAHGMQDKG